MTDPWRTPVPLHGNRVRLEGLARTHLPGLLAAGRDERLWEYMLYGNLSTPEGMAGWVESLLALQEQGTDLPFVVIHLPSGKVAGATRFMEMRPAHRALEIGGTWYGTEYQGTGINTECKYLLLRHAFEQLQCIRVQFKCDLLNTRSIRAIENLGAQREGTLRNQAIRPDGRRRDSVYFSILDGEWQGVKARLEARLASRE